MTTDKELLEAAARAAGLESYANEIGKGPVYRKYHSGLQDWVRWNPLLDDGDALRLAVKLRVDVTFNETDVFAFPPDGQDGASEVINTDDDCAATRRCIVRAAAALDPLKQGKME